MTIFLLLLGAVLLQFLAEWFYRKNWDRHLEVNVKFQEQPVHEGEKAYLTETIENRKWLLLPMLQAAFRVHRNLFFEEEENTSISDYTYKRDIFSVLFYQKIEREITFLARKRGYYEIEQAEILTRGLLMNREMYRTMPLSTHLYVYPRTIPVSRMEIPFKKLMGQVLVRQRMYEDTFSFRGLREYQPGDPMNKINWKASAKEGGLMVNLLDSTSSAQVLIYLDVEDETIWKYEEIHEAGISLAVSLAEQLLQRGIATGLVTNGRDHITEAPIAVLPGTGRGQLVKLYQNLARLDLDLPAGKFPELLSAQRRLLAEGRGIPVLISKNQGQPLFTEMETLAKAGGSALWISTLYKDMEWKLPCSPHMEIIRWEVPR